jgi:hypothetical protein
MRIEAVGSVTSMTPIYPPRSLSRSERSARIAEKGSRIQEKKARRSQNFFKPDWLGRYVDIYV